MGRKLIGVPRTQARVAGAEAGGERAAGDEPRAAAGGESDDAPTAADEPTTEADVESWVDRVKDAIPIEVVTAWAAIEAMIGNGVAAIGAWPYFALLVVMTVVTALHMWVDTETPTRKMATRFGVPFQYIKHAQYVQILLAVGAFLVWAYYLGGLHSRHLPALIVDPLPVAGFYDPTIAKVLLPLYVVVGPQLIPNVVRKIHGVEIPEGERRSPMSPEGSGGE